jgi:hypothetical protein
MSALTIPMVRGSGFTLESVDLGGPALRFTGNGDMEACPELNQFLAILHQELLRTGARAVTIDFSELYFMNSSCLKAFAAWINKLKDQKQLYRVRFLTNPALTWQRRSLETLQRFAPTIVSLSTDLP